MRVPRLEIAGQKGDGHQGCQQGGDRPGDDLATDTVPERAEQVGDFEGAGREDDGHGQQKGEAHGALVGESTVEAADHGISSRLMPARRARAWEAPMITALTTLIRVARSCSSSSSRATSHSSRKRRMRVGCGQPGRSASGDGPGLGVLTQAGEADAVWVVETVGAAGVVEVGVVVAVGVVGAVGAVGTVGAVGVVGVGRRPRRLPPPKPLPSEEDHAIDAQEDGGRQRFGEKSAKDVLEDEPQDANRNGGEDNAPGQAFGVVDDPPPHDRADEAGGSAGSIPGGRRGRERWRWRGGGRR